MARRLSAIALAAATAFAVVQAAASTRSGRREMPEFARVLDPDAAVTDIAMSLDRASVVSVEGVPDGGCFSATPGGGHDTVRIARAGADASLQAPGIPERRAHKRALQRIRTGLAFRGPWSDRASASSTLRGVRGGPGAASSGFVRVLREVDFFQRWKPDERAASRP